MRIALGDNAWESVERVFETRSRIGEELALVGLETLPIPAEFELSDLLPVKHRIENAEDALLAEAAQRIADGEAGAALALLQSHRPVARAQYEFILGTAFLAERDLELARRSFLRASARAIGELAGASLLCAAVTTVSSTGDEELDSETTRETIALIDRIVTTVPHWATQRSDALLLAAFLAEICSLYSALSKLLRIAHVESIESGVQVDWFARAADDPQIFRTEMSNAVLGFAFGPATRASDGPAPKIGDGPTRLGGDATLDGELAATLAELDAQIGLDGVKRQVRSILAQVQADQERARRGLSRSARARHLVFQGPPGTGKTTVARIIARIYHAVGLLGTASVVEAGRKDFVGEHLGSTTIRSNATFDRALDGVLFIDEAYAINDERGFSGGDAYGREALEVILTRMENDRDRTVVIIAGYREEIDRFLASNPGLESRFATRITFESYSARQLAEIAAYVGRESSAPLDTSAVDAFHERVSSLAPNLLNRLGNARFARECVYSAAEERDLRLTSDDKAGLVSFSDHDLQTITAVDIETAIDRRLASMPRGQVHRPE